jgi:hypothetical protein
VSKEGTLMDVESYDGFVILRCDEPVNTSYGEACVALGVPGYDPGRMRDALSVDDLESVLSSSCHTIGPTMSDASWTVGVLVGMLTIARVIVKGCRKSGNRTETPPKAPPPFILQGRSRDRPTWSRWRPKREPT